MKKNKNRQPLKSAPISKPLSDAKPETIDASTPDQKITLEAVKNSSSQSEFESNKGKLIENLVQEYEFYAGEKEKVEGEYNDAKLNLDKINTEIEQWTPVRNQLRDDCEKLEKQKGEMTADNEAALKLIAGAESQSREIVNQANADAERIKKQAKEDAGIDADNIKKEAQEERGRIILEADERAKAAWKTQVDNLQKQLDTLREEAEKIASDRRALNRERMEFEDQREDFKDIQDHVNALKERYAAANPQKVASLELELQDERDRYAGLEKKYADLSKNYNDVQVLLSLIQDEVEESIDDEAEESPDGKRRNVSLKQIVDELQTWKAKYNELRAITKEYPDDESIRKLKDKALKASELEQDNEALERERDRYRAEAVAARNASKALETIRQEVEATNALNEHLLQELESHKTALESRTGDTCPSLTKVDNETEEVDFVNDLKKRTGRPQIGSLRELVSHVRNYAGSRSKKEQLFYTENDIRAFLAGMAVSRLIILQGMSGTGKSSLPRIFSEAISGFNKLIPVESSWRDRNELLGYYNDFNKKFNAKSFTIELYRSCKERCQPIPTFIVLDEMNLARIEYYFSDFLAILEKPDHAEWLIELVSSDMRTLPMELPENVKQKMKKEEPKAYEVWERIERSRQGDLHAETTDDDKELLTSYLAKLGRLTGAKDLVDGRKIHITDNIWFIGTANRDESTFEISDKVYDRAQVVSLNRKGYPDGKYDHSIQKYISVDDLQSLFDEAILKFKHRDEVKDRLEKIDEKLVEYFDTSFGNRIVTQSQDFTAVFTAAGGNLVDALDYQISTKIIRKIISSDSITNLKELENITKEYATTQKLIQKRIKDLSV